MALVESDLLSHLYVENHLLSQRVGRHMGRVRIDLSLMQRLVCPTEPGRYWRIVDGVPPDAQYRGCAFDVDFNCFMLYWEHPSFPETREGGRIDHDVLVVMEGLECPQ